MDQELRNKVCELAFLQPDELEDSTPLFSSGHIDSISLLELIQFLEAQTGFKIPAGDVNLDNLDSIERINRYIARRKA